MRDSRKAQTTKGSLKWNIYTNNPINNRWNGIKANIFFKQLADKLSRKSGQRYSEAMTFIRKRIRLWKECFEQLQYNTAMETIE